MGRNFGQMGLEDFDKYNVPSCPESAKSGTPWHSKSESHDRYKGFIGDLAEKFEAEGNDRKRLSTLTVYHYLVYGYDPDVGIRCARTKQKNIEWLPPTYEDYLTVWNYYADQAARAGTYPDMRLVVQHFYEGRGPIVAVSATAVPTNVDEPAQQEAETTSRRGYQYRQKMRQLQRQRGRGPGTGTQGSFDVSAGPFSTGRDFMPGSGGASPGSSSQQETAISPDDVESEGMGLGLKIAIGLGVLGIGAFVARRQGWI